MRKRSFQPFAALSQQPFATRAANPPTIPVDGIASRGTGFPVAPPAIRFRDVAADADRVSMPDACASVVKKAW